MCATEDYSLDDRIKWYVRIFSALPVTQAANTYTYNFDTNMNTGTAKTKLRTHLRELDRWRKKQRTCVICKSVYKPNENESDSYQVEHATNLLNNFDSILYQYASKWIASDCAVRFSSYLYKMKKMEWRNLVLIVCLLFIVSNFKIEKYRMIAGDHLQPLSNRSIAKS